MRILVINSGSSTLKYGIYDTEQGCLPIVKGVAERIGEKGSFIRQQVNHQKERIELDMPDHKTAMHALFDLIKKEKVEGVGHRVVHGGEKLKGPTLIHADVIKEIEEVGRFVPLHYIPNLIGIQVAQALFPSVPHVAIFDTAPYATLDFKAFLYGIPVEFYEKHQIRRYGFHGINHQYVASEVAKHLGHEDVKIITCHLGSGCSITAFENGRSIDTSMGLTPLEGLVMETRSGDLDPSVVLYLIDVLGMKTNEIVELLNKKSGLLGLCGKKDMRDVIALAEKGDTWAQIAIDLFVYRIQKSIGAYIAALNGVDAIAFTGGIGENDPFIREKILANFKYMGASLQKEKNQAHALIFSSKDSKVHLFTIPANEEKVIAEQTKKLIHETIRFSHEKYC